MSYLSFPCIKLHLGKLLKPIFLKAAMYENMESGMWNVQRGKHGLLSFPPEATHTTSVPIGRSQPRGAPDLKAHTSADLFEKSDIVSGSTSDN